MLVKLLSIFEKEVAGPDFLRRALPKPSVTPPPYA